MRSTKLPSWIRGALALASERVPPHVFSLEERRLSYLSTSDEGEICCREVLTEELPDRCFQPGPLGGVPRDGEVVTRSLGELLGRMTLRPETASLVLPDHWLRLGFVEVDSWPRKRSEQLEMLRFKLKRLVPFRVEELRVGFQEVPALPSESTRRFLVGFGIEAALSQFEDVFLDRGIQLGWISNQTLSLLEVLRSLLEKEPAAAFVFVSPERYSLLVASHAEPVMYRGKSYVADDSLVAVDRELRLTRSFLIDKTSQGQLSEVILVAPADRERAWKPMIEDVFECPVSSLAEEWPSVPGLVKLTTDEAAPLLGAALREVA